MNIITLANELGASLKYAQCLRDAASAWKIEQPGDVARWLAQCSIESAGFARLEENLGYRAERLLQVFGGRNGYATLEMWQQVVNGGRRAIGNAIYGGSWGMNNLGNTEPDDGYRFRGRGFIQTTGRNNYRDTSMAVYGDLRLLTNPELLAEPEGGALAAAWFYVARGCIGVTDVKVITRKVNGGYNHLNERIAETERALQFVG
jgi:putative chitinase